MVERMDMSVTNYKHFTYGLFTVLQFNLVMELSAICRISYRPEVCKTESE